jgi:PAS domain S-box-containing protein
MDRLLARQLQRHSIEPDGLPENWQAVLATVLTTYKEFENDRLMLERSLELSSQELLRANAEMRAIFAALPDVVLQVDVGGTIMGHRGRSWPGVSGSQQVVGQRLADLAGRLSGPLVTALAQVVQRQEATNLEVPLIVDGQIYTYEARIIPILGKDLLVLLRDMTDKKRADEALRQSEQRFRALVENASDLIVIIDADGTIRFVSPSIERVMGYRDEDILGMNILSLVRPNDLEVAVESLANVINQPGIHPPERFHVRHKDGSWRYLEASGNGLLHDPSVRGIVINAREVSEHDDLVAA